jgi:hypothetical protein
VFYVEKTATLSTCIDDLVEPIPLSITAEKTHIFCIEAHGVTERP